MITYIFTAHPEKDIWKVFHDDTYSKIKKSEIILGEEITIMKTQNIDIQLILLPSMYGQKESKVLEFINEMRSEKIIENDDTGPFLFLHRNDFYINAQEAPNTGLRSGFKQDEALFQFNGKCYYYTTEGDDDLGNYFSENDPNDNDFYNGLLDFF